MLVPVHLGKDLERDEKFYLDPEVLARHAHFVGSTGSGKTVALHAILRPRMMEPRNKSAIFVLDALGGLSRDLLNWIASRKCPQHVRRRLVYIEPSQHDVVLPIDPLANAVGDDLHYHVARTIDLILRAWASQDLSQMARLAQWSYATATAMARLGLPIRMAEFLLHPGSPEHSAILRKLPDDCRFHWSEILNARGSESVRILESTRNRLRPFSQVPQLRRCLTVPGNRFDVERMIKERRIVIVNLSGRGKMSLQSSSTIGGLMLNEIFETAFKISSTEGRHVVDPTLIALDEFQRFVSPDVEAAIPTVRQIGVQLILAHQSFSQLEQGDLDLRSMIWQAANRLMFSNNAEDADIVANELAVMSFDPLREKHRIHSQRQLIDGYRREWMNSEGVSTTTADSNVEQSTIGFNQSSGSQDQFHPEDNTRTGYGRNTGEGSSKGESTGHTHAESESRTQSRSETLVPIHRNIEELSSIQYVDFSEQLLEWMKKVRTLQPGYCYGKFANEAEVRHLKIRFAPIRETKRLHDRVLELVQRNNEQDFFISKEEADRQERRIRDELLAPSRIVLHPPHEEKTTPSNQDPSPGSPFRRTSEND